MKNQVRKILTKIESFLYLTVFFSPSMAYAAQDTLSTAIKNICDYLDSVPVQALALFGILKIAYDWYSSPAGQFNKKMAIAKIVAICIIVGAPYYADTVFKGLY